MRLFVAIPLPPAVTESIRSTVTQLKSVASSQPSGTSIRWTSPEAWHITLQFLGEVPPARLPALQSHLAAIASPTFQVCLCGLGKSERAGVLFIHVAVSEPLRGLQLRVAEAAVLSGLPQEDQPYHPHITLVRSRGRSPALDRISESAPSAPAPCFHATEFLLYESFLGPQGARYEVRSRFPLEPA